MKNNEKLPANGEKPGDTIRQTMIYAAYSISKCLLYSSVVAIIWANLIAPKFGLPELGIWTAMGIWILAQAVQGPIFPDPFAYADEDASVDEFRSICLKTLWADIVRASWMWLAAKLLSHLV